MFEKNNLQVIEVFGLLNLINIIEKENLEKILSSEKNFKNIKEFLLSNNSRINGNQSPCYLENVSQIIKSIKNKKIKKIPYQMVNLINSYARGNKH